MGSKNDRDPRDPNGAPKPPPQRPVDPRRPVVTNPPPKSPPPKR